MDSIFSDDEEYETVRENLFGGSSEDKTETMVPMFGMYAIHKTGTEQKPRQDVFLRGMEAPTNDLDPYKQGTFQKNEMPALKKTSLCDNFSFFGMKQGKVRIDEKPTTSSADYGAERKMLLKKLEEMREQENRGSATDSSSGEDDEIESSKPKTPKSKPMQPRKTNVDTPRPRMEMRKRTRTIAISSSDESDEDAPLEQLLRSPRRKRVSPA